MEKKMNSILIGFEFVEWDEGHVTVTDAAGNIHYIPDYMFNVILKDYSPGDFISCKLTEDFISSNGIIE